MTTLTTTTRRSFGIFGMTAHVLVTEPEVAGAAVRLVRERLTAFDAVASRFREDSELTLFNRSAGRPFPASPDLYEAVEAALAAARLTDGAVDPTVGSALARIGYDRDISLVRQGAGTRAGLAPLEPLAVPGWRRVHLDPGPGRVARAGGGRPGGDRPAGTITLEPGVRLDLGATGKALAADRAAQEVGRRLGCGVLVSIGGDVAMAGPAPEGGWVIGISDVCDSDPERADAVVAVDGGGLATSGTAARSWLRDGERMHHVVDPATGLPARTPWRTVSVWAADCVAANTAATAALVMGRRARPWLAGLGHPARLVPEDGPVVLSGGWPR